MMKPSKPKPQFYAYVFEQLQEIAKHHGYNLLIHGSMNRDMDLIAVPWVDDPSDHFTLLKEFTQHLGVENLLAMGDALELKYFLPSILGGGRTAYVINLNRGERTTTDYDAEYYIDISFTPLVKG